MLDPTMMYSCGVFERRDATLEEASLAKLELRLREARPRPRRPRASRSAPAGAASRCYAARTRGCRVTTTTISREQHDVAVARVREAGARGPRRRCCSTTTATCAGSYDKLVSIEMIEAVGWQDFGTFFERCSRPAGARRRDAAAGDHDGRPRLRRSRRRRKSFIRTLRLPQRLPALAARSSPRCVATRTDMRTVAPRGPHAALRRDAAPLARELRGARRTSSTRSATTSASAGCGGMYLALLRGGLRRAPHRPRADRARQAALARRSPGRWPTARAGDYEPRLPAEHPVAERVEHERRAARGELGQRGLAAGAEDVVVGLDRRRRPSPAHSSGSTLSQPEVSM